MKKKHIPNTRSGLISLLASTVLGACGGGGGYGGNAPPPPPPPPPPMLGANFSEIQAGVFTPTCATSGCHSGAGAPQGLRLDAANSYALLVGVASSEVPSILRVAPNDPDNSYLVMKLEGTASSGAQMPFGGTPLPQATIDVIRQWITDGAIDDRVQATSPIRVSSLSPVPGSILGTAPASVTAVFDRDPDASTVTAITFILEGSGGDTTFGDGNEVSITAASISVPGTNTATAVFDLTGVALADDTYQVRLLGSGASMILDMDANALDGEFSGTFPSGDGSEGGDFEAEFVISTPVAMGATLDEIQAAVFTPTCSVAGCHTGPTSNSLPGGMNLSNADASFAALVGVASLQVPALSRVAANDPDNSYLVRKLEGTAAGGVRMPFGGGPLDPALIADIREWVTNGAQR